MNISDDAVEAAGTVLRYRNSQGSDIIAALDNGGWWSVLCIASPGHIHQFEWNSADLKFDIGNARVEALRSAGAGNEHQ
jgi:hypothetical protein